MKKTLLTILTSLTLGCLLTGCADGFQYAKGPTYQVDPEAMMYVSQFRLILDLKRIPYDSDHLIVEFVDVLPGNTLAQCIRISDQSPRVQIKNSYWKTADFGDKVQLVFHELGHCMLFLGHDSKLNSDGMPESIMNPYHFNSVYFMAHFQTYVEQLLSMPRGE